MASGAASQTSPSAGGRPQGSATPGAGSTIGSKGGKGEPAKEEPTRDYVDPLAHMSERDKWGLKGLRYMMQNFPAYNAAVIGIDPHTLGLDLNSTA